MDKLIGKNIVVKYFDHNVDFKSIFPRGGKIISRHKTDNVDDWYLVNLEKPFDYNGRLNKQLLIRSRWEGDTLKVENTSVFVLLIPDADLVKNEDINVNKFEHVVWSLAELC